MAMTSPGVEGQVHVDALDAHEGDTSAANGTMDAEVAASPSRAQKRALKRVVDAMEGFVQQLQCAICLCPYTKPASLPCNHCFCEECIHRALELKPVCPICKTPAKKRRLRYDTMIQQLLHATDLWASAQNPIDLTLTPEPVRPKTTVEAPSFLLLAEETTPVRINPLIVAAPSEERASPTRRRLLEESPTQPTQMTQLPSSPMLLAQVEVDVAMPSPEKSPEQANDTSHRPTNGLIPHTFPLGSKAQLERVITETMIERAEQHANGQSQPFMVGQLVEVIDRTWRGVNKPGGAAWITEINADGTYNVRYIIGTRKESNIPDMYILIPREEMVSFASPGSSVKKHRRKSIKSSKTTPQSVDLLANGHLKHRPPQADAVLLFSGYSDDDMIQMRVWADTIGAQVLNQWSDYVTHVIAKCATNKEIVDNALEAEAESGSAVNPTRKRALFREQTNKRWVKIRSLKYLKGLVGGRWIVSEGWLRECARQGKRVSEAAFETDGHLKAQHIESACRRARLLREANLHRLGPSPDAFKLGTQLFVGLCFHIFGEFLPPMPPPSELDTLLRIGGGKVIRYLDDIAAEMDKEENRGRILVIICDKLNAAMLRRTTKELTALPQLQSVEGKRVVSYQWLLNSISEATLRSFQ
ncbi:hypothetical protein Poli38472_002847 [Pythium oligandrum]|uniref:RING-type E3 ubiquitin transferase BRCA1 n=1 Tax=Pythium oligandrum TaxID=41045 RepID=A0A8K1C6G5_PYTOL|nr:hypothetical protein Poli38472_002847 [Pythium oligandrum]|eukprot:TMW56922.1 hypothetical protein Poli38472_002847 [Pythium oligandrum]